MYTILICVLPILYKIFAVFLTRFHNDREARNRGCLPPAKAPNLGLFGLNTLRASIAATKAGHGPQWMHKMLNDIGKDIHTVRADILDYQLLITRNPENIKAIFQTQASDFDIGPHREKTFKAVFGLGAMTARGEVWKHSRALVRPQFAKPNIANLEMFEKHFQCLLKRLEVGESGWTDGIDLQPLFQNFTLDTGTEFLYGESVYTQDVDMRARLPLSWEQGDRVPDISRFGYHLDEIKAILDRQGAMAKYNWLFISRAFSYHRREIWKLVDYFVAKALSNDEGAKAGVSNDMQGKFVLLNELVKETRDPLVLRNETLNVLHASRDTTAALLGWIIYFLARYEDIQTKLRLEVLSAFSTVKEEDGPIKYASLQSMRYMQHVVNETIRIVGIIPMNERAATCDTSLPRGGRHDGLSPVFVAKGQQILIPTYSLQHREDLWGRDHEKFRPERWEERRHSWTWLPFGSGIRQCLGQQFARTEAMYVAARLLQSFSSIKSIESPASAMSFHHTIENRSGTGVRIRMCAEATMILRSRSLEDGMSVERGGQVV